jgi:hypothetical protein
MSSACKVRMDRGNFRSTFPSVLTRRYMSGESSLRARRGYFRRGLDPLRAGLGPLCPFCEGRPDFTPGRTVKCPCGPWNR